jgi:hypothetical protein
VSHSFRPRVRQNGVVTGGTEDDVRGLVAAVLAAEDFDGKPELLAQVPFVRVVGGPITFLDLVIEDPEVRRSALIKGCVPGQCWVSDEQGNAIGGLLVWVDDGYISALEYFWHTDEPPTRLPAVSQLSYEQV